MSTDLLILLFEITLLRQGGQQTVTAEELEMVNREYAGIRYTMNGNGKLTLTLRTRLTEGEVV